MLWVRDPARPAEKGHNTLPGVVVTLKTGVSVVEVPAAMVLAPAVRLAVVTGAATVSETLRCAWPPLDPLTASV